MFIRHACVVSLVALVACGGSSSGIEDPAAKDGSVGGESEAGGKPGSDDGGPAISGPEIAIVMRGAIAPFSHADSFAGATPKKEIVAIRSLYLLRQPADPSPLRVFDLGAKAAPVELVSGKPVEITRVVAKTLPAGVFTIAKAGVSYVKYAVDARMHATVAVDGQYDNVQALSEGAVIDGVPRKKGYFRYSFVTGGMSVGALEGEDAPVPAVVTSGGIGMDASGPETFYVFPVALAIDPDVAADHEALFEVNVYESFRWQDQVAPGYQAKVFDTTPTSFEPVMAFGANSFKLTTTAK